MGLVRGTQKGFDLQVALVDQKGEGEDDLPAILMRFYILREFDQAWQQHLRDLEFLRENVGFQSYSQKDPFQEWTIQSNELFTKLSAKVYRNSAISWLSLDASGIVAGRRRPSRRRHLWFLRMMTSPTPWPRRKLEGRRR